MSARNERESESEHERKRVRLDPTIRLDSLFQLAVLMIPLVIFLSTVREDVALLKQKDAMHEREMDRHQVESKELKKEIAERLAKIEDFLVGGKRK